MLPEFNSKHIYARMRRLAVPITIGMFLITITSLGIVCVQQLIVQKNIRAQIQTNTLAYKSADKNEKFQEKFEVASKAIPVISINIEFEGTILRKVARYIASFVPEDMFSHINSSLDGLSTVAM